MYTTVTYLPAAIFFFTTLLSGFFVLNYPQKVTTHSRLLLTFGGSFLFSLTLLHLLPEVYHHVEKYPFLRYCLLLGFFFQFFLDLLSNGIAHGHTHKGDKKLSGSAFGLFSALFIHALFDGLLLGDTMHSHAHRHSLLIGVVLHKVPTTFALMAILLKYAYKKPTIVAFLFLFSLASPLGCFLPRLLDSIHLLETKWLLACWALAVGNLLHIATTILAEANADHRLSIPQMMAYLAGAFFSIMADMY